MECPRCADWPLNLKGWMDDAIVGPFEHPCGPGIEYPGQTMYEGSFANKSIMMHAYVFIMIY